MNEFRVLVAGCGEIGSSFITLLKDANIEYGVIDPLKDIDVTNEFEPNILEVCFPCKDQSFIDIINSYVKQFPTIRVVIIESTINPIFFEIGMLERDKEIYYVHSPCRGTHPNLVKDLREYVKFCGSLIQYHLSNIEFNLFVDYYTSLGIILEWMDSFWETAYAKFVNTTWYGLQIAFVNEIWRMCNDLGMNFYQVYTRMMQSDTIGQEYVKINGRAVATTKIMRPVMTPGVMGGHCILPNLELMKGAMNDHLYAFMKESNEYIKDDTEKITCYCGYLGVPIQKHTFDSYSDLRSFLNTLRPANKRPSHLIVEGITKDQVQEIADKVLYASQVFLKTMNALQGGTSYTRRYLCRHFKYDDGGDF